MALKFPPDCDTPAKRTEYCYRSQELLRRLHNAMGRWYREGLTQTQWDKLPQRIKDRYPYKARLSQAEWEHIHNRIVDDTYTEIGIALSDLKDILCNSNTWTIDLNSIIRVE